ncbi:MAG TPA: hypothetical protein VFO10_22800 [Oligoflexus sp.]|uniref:hypothetical protein n=1 Tax=Oligoflexus sp. TaxID=1971216 RepID=UPI002D7F0C47|nr:hypothetical protein [Oligoflexus sp.]HET9240110.1 hypothetical protein [Oligoflexus sp.]
MKLSALLLAISFASSIPALAHDEGHGPKLSDTGKFGGLVSAVVAKKDAKLGPKAQLMNKAELVRSPDGKLQVYVYDAEMKPVDASAWDKTAKVTMATEKKGKWQSKDFTITYDGKAFSGQMPAPIGKPFNLDFVFKAKDKELLSAFDNLD